MRAEDMCTIYRHYSLLVVTRRLWHNASTHITDGGPPLTSVGSRFLLRERHSRERCTMHFLVLNMNIALRRLLHNHGKLATDGSPKPGLCPTLILNEFKGSL